jgi:hypothetical protein
MSARKHTQQGTLNGMLLLLYPVLLCCLLRCHCRSTAAEDCIGRHPQCPAEHVTMTHTTDVTLHWQAPSMSCTARQHTKACSGIHCGAKSPHATGYTSNVGVVLLMSAAGTLHVLQSMSAHSACSGTSWLQHATCTSCSLRLLSLSHPLQYAISTASFRNSRGKLLSSIRRRSVLDLKPAACFT